MEEKPHEHKKLLAVGVVAAVVAILLITVVVVLGIMSGGGTKSTEKDTPAGDAATGLFYDALSNAAKQQALRVAMYRATYATKVEADAKQKPGTEVSSVVEVDALHGKNRAVYASSAVRAPEFAIGRCMNGTEYIDDYSATKQPRPTSLAEAAEALRTNQHLAQVTENLVFVVCRSLGIVPGGSLDLASFRVSDGIFPVTFTDAQAKNWKNKLQEADLFVIKDEGVVERNAKQVRKISFSPRNETGVNQKLYNIFYETGEIEKVKRDHPDAIWQYEFLTVNPANTGSVSGFYLIDEATKLPVYSEMKGINPDKEADKGGARFNIARTKQTYNFGQPLSLTLESPLELLE